MSAPATALIVVGCSRRKLNTPVPVPALDLYQGGVIPQLRVWLAGCPLMRSSVRILSAEHGVIGADRPILPYDRRLNLCRVDELQPVVRQQLTPDLPTVHMGLVIAEPLYQQLIRPLFDPPPDRRVWWISDPYDWPAALAVLDSWSLM